MFVTSGSEDMRVLCLLVLIIVTILEIGPIPISGLLLIWVVLFRPMWFYDLVQKIYGKQ
jgi:hypothetical protein